MGAWDEYFARNFARGVSRRDTILRRERATIRKRARDSLSFHHVLVYDADHSYNIDTDEMRKFAREQDVTIINSDNLEQKTIISLPGEDIKLGSLIRWMDNYWMVTARDANKEVYTRAQLLQCNFLLKWVTEEGKIYEQWCAIEDGTKYLTGEMEDKFLATTRGDSRIAMTIIRNNLTVKFNRENRFLIDDIDSPHKLSYQLTKPLKLGLEYNEEGVFKFVLQEVTATTYDNHELGIADYYKYYPNGEQDFTNQNQVIDPTKTDPETGKEVWL